MEIDLLAAFESEGTFWRPETTESRAPGKLKYEPNKTFILELANYFPGDPAHPLSSAQDKIIWGVFLNGQKVTLIDTFVQSRPWGAGGAGAVRIVVNQCLIGGHFTANSFQARKMHLRLTSLEEWFNQVVFTATFQTPTDKNTRTVSYCKPTPMRAELPDSGLTLTSAYAQRENVKVGEVNLAHRSYFGFESQEIRPLDYWLEIGSCCQNLLTLLVGQPVAARELVLTRVENCADERDEHRYVAVSNVSKIEEHVHVGHMFLSYPLLGEQLLPMFQKWFADAAILKDASNVYFGNLYHKPATLEDLFLGFIHAIEGIHRAIFGQTGLYMASVDFDAVLAKLYDAIPNEVVDDHRASLKNRLKYANEYSLRKRLDQMLKSLPQEIGELIAGNFGTFVQRIVNTRNHLTHLGSQPTDAVIIGTDLYFAAERLRILAHVLLSRHIGIEDKAILDYLKRDPQIQWVISHPFANSPN